MVANMSPLQLAKRALVTLLLALGRQYHIALAINRDSSDNLVLAAFKKVARKAHPDKGGYAPSRAVRPRRICGLAPFADTRYRG